MGSLVKAAPNNRRGEKQRVVIIARPVVMTAPKVTRSAYKIDWADGLKK
jgi:hypothetical protein